MRYGPSSTRRIDTACGWRPTVGTEREILVGLEGGVDEFEHIGTGAAGAEFSASVVEAIRIRVRGGPPLYWAPTVASALSPEFLRDNPEVLDDPEAYRGLPVDIAQYIRRGLSTFTPSWDPTTTSTVRRKVDQLREAGVILLIGSDGGPLGNLHLFNIANELEGWVRTLGVQPAVVLRMATADAAMFTGVARDYGTLVPGKFADIVVVRGDPLRNLGVLRYPHLVFKHGRRARQINN